MDIRKVDVSSEKEEPVSIICFADGVCETSAVEEIKAKKEGKENKSLQT